MTVRVVGARLESLAWTIAPTGAARGRTAREAIVLEVRTADGVVGRGEAAPLSGMSRETVGDARASLAGFVARPLEALALEAYTDVAAIAESVAVASARFAVETALLDALAQTRGCTIADLLPRVPCEVLPPSTVVEDMPPPAAPVLKLKVGPGLDLDRVTAVAAAAPGATLRLDANRSWPRELVRGYLRALSQLPIAYVEEPCLDAHALLAEPLPCPIALDESLASMTEADLARAIASPGLAALVLKPTVLGGFARCLQLAQRGVPVVVTHALEGEVGRAACEALRIALEHGARATHSARSRQARAVHEARRAARLPEPVDERDTVPTAAPVISRGGLAEKVDRRDAVPGAERVIAEPTWATVEMIRGALAERRPVALLHAKLPAAELARQRALVETSDLPADTAFVLFTSGSTGPARGVVLSRAAIEAAAAASAATLGWRDDDRWLLALSTAHAGGLAVVVRCHLAGVPIEVLEGDWDRARAIAALARCTLASLVPTQLASLLEDPAWRPPPRLRAVLLGGAAASPRLLATAAARGVPFLTSYGLTETFGQVATAPLAHAGDPEPPLVPLPGVELRAGTGDDPQPIRIRGTMLATAYLDGTPIAPELVTADLGTFEQGVLRVIGRADDVIISGGEKVHPSVVEAVVTATPGVRAACAFGVADARWGDVVAAALVVEPGFDREAALARWHDRLPPHARPRELAFVDALPLGPTGKVDRRRAALAAREAISYAR